MECSNGKAQIPFTLPYLTEQMLITVGQHVFDGTDNVINEIEQLNNHRSPLRDAMDKLF